MSFVQLVFCWSVWTSYSMHHKLMVFYHTVRDWNLFSDDAGQPWAIQGLHLTINCIWDTPPVIVKLERESRCFYEEPEISISISISTTVLHVDLFLCYALSTASTSTATNHWSGVFNLLKFDHTPKKERNVWLAAECQQVWGHDSAHACPAVLAAAVSIVDVAGAGTTLLVSSQLKSLSVINSHIALWQPRRSCRQG